MLLLVSLVSTQQHILQHPTIHFLSHTHVPVHLIPHRTHTGKINNRVGGGGGKRVFGEPLDPDAVSIPDVVANCVRYLERNGMLRKEE